MLRPRDTAISDLRVEYFMDVLRHMFEKNRESNVLGRDCDLSATATAPDSGLTMPVAEPHATSATARIKVDTKNPVAQYGKAPAISAEMNYIIKKGGSYIIGQHDRMPMHEIWGGPYPGEYSLLYHSKSAHLACLVGSLPGCTVYVNVSM